MLLREQVQAPERYMRQITGANNAFMLCIDAYVEIPNHEKMPIAEIAPIDFSQPKWRRLEMKTTRMLKSVVRICHIFRLFIQMRQK